MTKENVKNIFMAGAEGSDFDQWYAQTYTPEIKESSDEIDINFLCNFYREVFTKLGSVSPEKAMNTRKQESADLKHIVRATLKGYYGKTITYKDISKIEILVGCKKMPNHATIINSLERMEEDVPGRKPYTVREVKKIFNKYII